MPQGKRAAASTGRDGEGFVRPFDDRAADKPCPCAVDRSAERDDSGVSPIGCSATLVSRVNCRRRTASFPDRVAEHPGGPAAPRRDSRRFGQYIAQKQRYFAGSCAGWPDERGASTAMHPGNAAEHTGKVAFGACAGKFPELASFHGFRLQGRSVGSAANLEGHGRALINGAHQDPYWRS